MKHVSSIPRSATRLSCAPEATCSSSARAANGKIIYGDAWFAVSSPASHVSPESHQSDGGPGNRVVHGDPAPLSISLHGGLIGVILPNRTPRPCLLYTSDAADE